MEEEMDDCIFCKIADKKIPATIIYEDDQMMAFYDVAPQAPAHALIITKKHISSLDDCTNDDVETLGKILNKVKDIAQEIGIENGYRLVINCGENGMQTVKHLHFHLLGNRQMTWPPG
jgi:histidine triad (HIT) family protein